MLGKNLKKGFTLIELLVVIAIIGILAAIALTSLGTARDKAKDSSAQGSISSARAAAEIFFDDNGNSYDDGTNAVCADVEVNRLVTAAESQTATTAVCNDTATEYAISIPLLSGDFFCVDSNGDAGKSATAITTETVCP